MFKLPNTGAIDGLEKLMQWPDMINGGFEFAGALLTWMNVRRIHQDQGYAGIFAPAIILFTSWGLWNLYYYPSLGQWWSFAGGIVLASANVAWLALMLYYGPIGRPLPLPTRWLRVILNTLSALKARQHIQHGGSNPPASTTSTRNV